MGSARFLFANVQETAAMGIRSMGLFPKIEADLSINMRRVDPSSEWCPVPTRTSVRPAFSGEGHCMDVKEQLDRLLALTERARQHAAELDSCQAEAQNYVDTAEYDLKCLMGELREVLNLAPAAGADSPTPELHKATG
jgi:hypothetical protein